MSIFMLVLFLYGKYISLDWTPLIFNTSKVSLTTFKHAEIAKVLVSFLCTFVVILIGKDGYDKGQTIALKTAFIAIFTGDLLFFFDFIYLAVVAFFIAHILLIIRNGAGMTTFLKVDGHRTEKRKVFIIGIGSLYLYISIISFIFYPKLHGNVMLYLVMVYALLLCISIWIAWSTIIVSFMPQLNGIFTALGMSFFLLCDLSVGINFFINEGFLKSIAPCYTWTFYTAALVLLSLSGYRFQRKS
jgi:hypothetical protein